MLISLFKKFAALAAFTAGITGVLNAQNTYKYSLNLNDVKNDQLTVSLICPKVSAPKIIFYMPKIVPGTYRYSDFGKFVHNLKAYSKTGRLLPVTQTSDNSWAIGNATALNKIVYDVEDTWDSAIPNSVYAMAGTNFEAGKNFVLNTCGIFGYLDKMKNIPFEINVSKPQGFYGATGLKATATSANLDTYLCRNADHLYDSPMMYSVPDTTTINVGGSNVLVAVYSAGKKVTSAFMAANLKEILQGTNKYLGGKLPVDKYAFIYYFNSEQKPFSSNGGAWEHSYSSFYSLDEEPQEKGIAAWADMSAHEFFHIVTPLTISSKEVKQFNFNVPNLSKHLWLYEGSTEYDAHHMQVKNGLNSPAQFLQKLSGKISYSRQAFIDTLSFTAMSKEVAGRWKSQYNNVYMKGALISNCLDLYLLQLSGGQYGITNLKHDLGIKYGKDKYFNDDELFDAIAAMTYPQIRQFFSMYVEGNKAIPYEHFFEMAGVKFSPVVTTSSFTLGGFQPGGTPEGNIFVANTDKLNAFGKAVGYQKGDELVSLNGTKIDATNFGQVVQGFYASAKEGETVEIKLNRKNATGSKEEITIKQPAVKVQRTEVNKLEFMDAPTPEQMLVRNAWLGKNEPVPFSTPADPKDVNSVDAIIKATYDVISGPAGDRNWSRFQSLFYPGAYMGATNPGAKGDEFHKFTPAEYIKSNAPLFKQFNFTEKEIGRTVSEFGNIAQVFTTYEYTLGTPKPTVQRGINSLSLVKEKGRWWILNIIWDEEAKGKPIPAKFVNN